MSDEPQRTIGNFRMDIFLCIVHVQGDLGGVHRLKVLCRAACFESVICSRSVSLKLKCRMSSLLTRLCPGLAVPCAFIRSSVDTKSWQCPIVDLEIGLGVDLKLS